MASAQAAQASPVAEVSWDESEVGWANVLQAAVTFAAAWFIAGLLLHRCSKVVAGFASSSASAAEDTQRQMREEVFVIKIDTGDKGVYTGTTHNWQKDGLRHGKGSMKYDHGPVYHGEWKDGFKHGEGTQTWSSGSTYLTYVGQWKYGTQNGEGTRMCSSGSTYIGQWKNGTQNGEGTYTSNDGSKFVGQWKNGDFHGKGLYTSKSGKKYTGPWQNDKTEHDGKMTCFMDLP